MPPRRICNSFKVKRKTSTQESFKKRICRYNVAAFRQGTLYHAGIRIVSHKFRRYYLSLLLFQFTSLVLDFVSVSLQLADSCRLQESAMSSCPPEKHDLLAKKVMALLLQEYVPNVYCFIISFDFVVPDHRSQTSASCTHQRVACIIRRFLSHILLPPPPRRHSKPL